MSRVGVALLVGVFAIASGPAEATTTAATTDAEKPAPIKPATKKKTTKKKKPTKKKVASKTSKSKKTTSKKNASKTASRKKKGRMQVASKSSRRKAKRGKTGKQVAMRGDDRARYGGSNMPPGFAWPPNAAMKAASSACEKQLDTLGIVWEPAKGEGRMVDPIVVPAMEIGGIKYISIYKKPPHTIDCQLVHTLASIGPELHAIGVREVKFGSIYRNTQVRAHGQTKNILSRHALGLAMDIKAFVDDKGRVASVELDYLKGDPLLHGIEDVINASNRFRIVLTPGNDPISHYDHFHVEASVDFTAFR